ncbi:MAG: DUF917 domain-containing protein [Chloroflexi bacterium]|nr:MAG: DUF917 domain-containing protein [Chloroflexota bacterium]
MRLLHEQNIEDIALGAAVLGTGGGGDPYIGKVMAREAIRQYGPVELWTLDEFDDDDLIVPSAGIGAPAVLTEKLPSGDDMIHAFKALGKYMGKPPRATMSIEAGGLNSIMPIYVAARLQIPMLDSDGMGRAFPEIQLTIFTTYGISATPLAMADERGNTVIMETIDNYWTERFARSVVGDMGAMGMMALYGATIAQLKEASLPGTITYAEDIGRTVRLARINEESPVDAVREAVGGFLIFTGKITDVDRRIEGGWNLGDCKMEGVDDFAGRNLLLNFQNEHLAVRVDGEFAATVPDLITVLDIDTGEPITTEALRYGMRVAVIAFPCHEKWRTPAGLELANPRYFGYDVDYIPVEERYRS